MRCSQELEKAAEAARKQAETEMAAEIEREQREAAAAEEAYRFSERVRHQAEADLTAVEAKLEQRY